MEESDIRRSAAILALRGRDGALARNLLAKEGIGAIVLASGADLVEVLRRHVGCVLLTEESLTDEGIDAIRDALAGQPAWSDVPFIVLANGSVSQRSARAKARMDALRNAVLLSRPLHTEELMRAVRSALAARTRQNEARQRMEELELREAQLRQSEARFHAIVDSVDQMIWSTLPDGYHDFYNQRWYDYTGVPPGSTDGEAWNGMFHPEDQERAFARWRHSLQTGELYEIEYRLRHQSGEYRWVLGRAQPVCNEAGEIIRWYGTCTDIHDEVMARTARVDDLTEQRDAAWNLTVDLLAVATEDGTLTDVNESWTRLLGWPVKTLVGGTLIPYAHPDDLEEMLRTFGSIFETPLVEPYEFRLRHADGSYRWFAWTASAQRGKVYAFGRDVNERRAKEAALAEAEAALRQSQKLDMIGQLTGGVAHDFNNLLMAIQSSLDLIKRRMPDLDGDVVRYFDNALQATDRGARLTQRMLAFARKQDLRADAVDVTALLPDLRDLLQRSLGPEIEIVIDVPANAPHALVDRNQLEMAILNLAVNGRDAMEGSGRITLSVEPLSVRSGGELKPGDYVRIAVTDTGAGMDAGTLSQAMEPFFTTKGVGKGTGLGLSMVHGLAMQSGGTFLIDSTPGAGTTATLVLPVAEPSAETPAPIAAKPREPARTAKGRKTILAVDDDFLVSMGTVGMLEDLGHEVIEAHSGAEALDRLAERPDIDVLITDQAMPKMTGIELARQARISRPDLPIILATGYADMPEGGADFITAKLDKPFSDAALTAVLSEVI
ncbi:hybrid sensor histidine kinase/response regulator [Oricola cellulosilytica]|uniref:histidine kinase n=1 Tax=Oricola cellulosilytica TaxID=1429082 RepID=A0A4V2MNQ0_9HYPH|nr:hybrid sensor histidine kinase/response regulator [Oricola cellulosilytica]